MSHYARLACNENYLHVVPEDPRTHSAASVRKSSDDQRFLAGRSVRPPCLTFAASITGGEGQAAEAASPELGWARLPTGKGMHGGVGSKRGH